MGHHWIIAVLDDLRTYAELNGLTRLAASLEGAQGAALGEIAAAEAGTPEGARGRHGAGHGFAAGAAGGGADAR